MTFRQESRARGAPCSWGTGGRGLREFVVALALCCCASYARAEAPAGNWRPSFAVRLAAGALRIFHPAEREVDNETLQAAVELVDEGTWQLTLKPKTNVSEVWFPWPQEREPLSPTTGDDILLYPTLMGMAYSEAGLQEWAWKGVDYPGRIFAPLVVTTNADEARLDAAVNWPPRRVNALFSLQRVAFVYRDDAPVGRTQQYRWLVRRVRGDPNEGIEPWQRAVDVYKTWLLEHMRGEKLYPINYPQWLLESDGWLNVQLQNSASFEPLKVARLYERFREYFPWVQFWGQMSDYAGPRRTGALQDEPTGCCLQQIELHQRYLPDLPRLAEQIARDGHVGFYSRPRDFLPLDSAALENRAFLLNWLRKLGSYGANAFYVDVLGHEYYGDPLTVARFVRDDLPAGTVIEFPVDIYPGAYLVSGCLFDNLKATLGRDLEALRGVSNPEGMRFERFGRYLLDDRVIFLGESNSDHRGWGPEHDYQTERRAFLIGAKLDVMHPAEGDELTGPMNRVVRMIVTERRRTGWWAMQPAYRDRQGISGVPRGVDVRRFRGKQGETLLAFENWRREPNLRILVDGLPMPVPEDALAIRVLTDQGAAVSKTATGRRS